MSWKEILFVYILEVFLFSYFLFMKKDMVRRLIVSVILWILFGLLCVQLASGPTPNIRGTPLMRSILFNRFLIGVVVAMMGIYTIHPILGFKCYILRGAFFGALISVAMAIGIYMDTTIGSAEQCKIFWMTIVAWAIYGLVIDLVATRLGGQGKGLLHSKQK